MTGSLGFVGLQHDAAHPLWALEEHAKRLKDAQ
jgi:hypothetical protein